MIVACSYHSYYKEFINDKKTTLAKAIALAAISVGSISTASASNSIDNRYNSYGTSNLITGGSGTDGWTIYGADWTGGSTPFVTTARAVNWGAEITAVGDS